MGMEEASQVGMDERVVLSKYEGDPEPENEFERVVIQNGTVVEHIHIEHGEATGPVEDSELVGQDVGRLISNEQVKEEN